jgi:D-arabinose 1-dehydrogenase-like Zn-dependent alcohol dehydrogenase
VGSGTDWETGCDGALEREDVMNAVAAICGTDLHIYEGRVGDAAGMVIP